MQVTSVMSMWTRMQPAYAANMWNEALNKRLGTEVYLDAVLPYIQIYNYMYILPFIIIFFFIWTNPRPKQVEVTLSWRFRLAMVSMCFWGYYILCNRWCQDKLQKI